MAQLYNTCKQPQGQERWSCCHLTRARCLNTCSISSLGQLKSIKGNVVLSSSSPPSSSLSLSPAHASLWVARTGQGCQVEGAQARLVDPREAAPFFTTSKDTTVSCHPGTFIWGKLPQRLNLATLNCHSRFFWCFFVSAFMTAQALNI